MKTYEHTASYWRRLGAFVIDLLLFDFFILSPWSLIVMEKFSFTGYDQMYSLLISSQTLLVTFYIVAVFMTLLLICYFTIFQFILGQTLGMMLFKLRVVSLEGELSMGKCFFRNLFLIPFFPFSFLWAIEPIHLFFSSEGQS